MYDALKCGFLSGLITLFANVPELFEYPLEKLGFGAILFFIIWTYMKTILPKTHEEIQKLREENRKLLDEISTLNRLRKRDQKIMAVYLKDQKQHAETLPGKSGVFHGDVNNPHEQNDHKNGH